MIQRRRTSRNWKRFKWRGTKNTRRRRAEVAMQLGAIFRPGMRAYFVPLFAGLVLFVSAFLPWVIVGGFERRGIPDLWALWVAGLGLLAATLAFLSLLTRKNSRHPLLVV